MFESPIIFIHYGDSPYLIHTLKIAKQYNHKKEIILLGDDSNKKYQKIGVRHFNFNNYLNSELTKNFLSKFYIINGDSFKMAGKDQHYTDGSPGHYWQKFNWLRYFILNEFMLSNNIKKVWTFDSDNLIVTDLCKIEGQFENYDFCQLHGQNSMQGLINNQMALESFCIKMLEIYCNPEFLNSIKNWFKNSGPHITYTEMTAFNEFLNQKSGFKSIDVCDSMHTPLFDNTITYSQGFELKEYTNGIILKHKKVFYKNGKFYFKRKIDGNLVETVNLDLSWTPIYFFDIIRTITKRKLDGKFIELNFKEPIQKRFSRFFRHYSKWSNLIIRLNKMMIKT